MKPWAEGRLVDRMASMFGGPLVAATVYAVARRHSPVKPWPLWIIGLMLLPMMVDGVTHMASDALYGVGQGFRDSNQWLVALTGNILPPWFYRGDGLGSFNSWMRLGSGLLFGFALGWAVYPWMDASASNSRRLDELKTEGKELLEAYAARQLEQGSD
jgi:hypothetical protein